MGFSSQLTLVAGAICVLAPYGALAASAPSAHWIPSGPFGGNAESIVVSPANPSILIAGTKNANLFISKDGGESWQSIAFPRQYSAMLHMLVMDPSDAAVIYAAVADGTLPGLYRTRNTGKTWEPVKGLGGAEVYSLAIWPKDSHVMAVGMRDGVRLTRDAGASWEPISPAGNIELQPVVSVAFDPRNSDVIYAGTPRLPWKTSDGGANWTLIADGMSTDSDIITLRVDPGKPSRVFIGACSGFWRSTNAGALWSKMSGIPFASRRTYAFAQDPQHPEVIFAGTSRGLYRTLDGGAEWKNIAANEIKGLAIANGTLYVASADNGLLKSADRGDTFLPINNGFTSRNFAPVTEAGEHVYTGTNAEVDAGAVFRSSDGGLHWEKIADPAALGFGNIIAVARSGAGTLLAATSTGLYRSTDGGAAWTRTEIEAKATVPRAAAKPARVSRVTKKETTVAAPLNPLHLTSLCALKDAIMAGTEAGLYRSTDEGLTWSLVAADGVPIGNLLSARDALALTAGRLLVSQDDGATWTPRHLPFFSEVYGVAASGKVILAGTSRGVFRSEDGAMTWQAADSGLPIASVTSVAMDRADPNLAFAFEFGSFYESRDGGKTWRRSEEEGLGGAFVRNLAITSLGPRHLLAVTATRGIFVRELDGETLASSGFPEVDLRKDRYVENQQNDKTPAF
jgi:photosystem II stability/assembly factor-like uncharacterized protein